MLSLQHAFHRPQRPPVRPRGEGGHTSPAPCTNGRVSPCVQTKTLRMRRRRRRPLPLRQLVNFLRPRSLGTQVTTLGGPAAWAPAGQEVRHTAIHAPTHIHTPAHVRQTCIHSAAHAHVKHACIFALVHTHVQRTCIHAPVHAHVKYTHKIHPKLCTLDCMKHVQYTHTY